MISVEKIPTHFSDTCNHCPSIEKPVFCLKIGGKESILCTTCLDEVANTIQQKPKEEKANSFHYTLGQQTKPLIIEALQNISKENFELKQKINVKEKEKLLLTHEEKQIESWKAKIQTNSNISNTLHYIGEQLTIAESISVDETTYQLIRTKLKP